MDEVPADLNMEEKVNGHLQDHLQDTDTNRPFPGLTMAYNENQPNNFKSPTSLQKDTWKKGLEAVLQPNSILVMSASTRSQKEVVPLQNSTLVMFESKTSTGSEKTHQNLEMGKHSMLKPLDHYILIGWTCDQRQLLQDHGLYWNFMKGLYVGQDIEDKSSRPVVGEYPIHQITSNNSRKQFMEFYSTLHSSHDVPYQERGSAAESTLCKYPACPMCPCAQM